MENTSKRRVGRPKATGQVGPLVLEGRRDRVKIELEIVDGTADELREYARWVELSSSVTTTEALYATVEYALREVFRRDRLWHERRRQGAEPEPSPRLKSPPTPMGTPVSLPPPSGAASPRGTSERNI